MTADPCHKVRIRVAHDKKRGHTTSQAAIEFIRRTCACDSCAAGRQKAKAAKSSP
jgi:hypothetical protein